MLVPKQYRAMKVGQGAPYLPLRLAKATGYYSREFYKVRKRRPLDPQGNVYTPSLGRLEGLDDLPRTGISAIDGLLAQMEVKTNKLELALQIITPAAVIAALTGVANLLRGGRR